MTVFFSFGVRSVFFFLSVLHTGRIYYVCLLNFGWGWGTLDLYARFTSYRMSFFLPKGVWSLYALRAVLRTAVSLYVFEEMLGYKRLSFDRLARP